MERVPVIREGRVSDKSDPHNKNHQQNDRGQVPRKDSLLFCPLLNGIHMKLPSGGFRSSLHLCSAQWSSTPLPLAVLLLAACQNQYASNSEDRICYFCLQSLEHMDCSISPNRTAPPPRISGGICSYVICAPIS